MIGINVNSKNIPYADLIIDGLKQYESRNSDTLRPYIGRRVAIVRTGRGKALAIGMVTIGEPVIVTVEQFRQLETSHLVQEGDIFDIQPGGTKHLYPMIDPVRFEEGHPVAHGIIARRVLPIPDKKKLTL